MVIVFELLGLNLYKFMRQESFSGFNKNELKLIAG
jgi:hypothetical protein